jgi:hypothetical protein
VLRDLWPEDKCVPEEPIVDVASSWPFVSISIMIVLEDHAVVKCINVAVDEYLRRDIVLNMLVMQRKERKRV